MYFLIKKYYFDKPTLWIATTSEQRPLFSGPEGGRYTQVWLYIDLLIQIQCPPLNWITLGQIKSDNINRMIQLTEDTFLLLTY